MAVGNGNDSSRTIFFDILKCYFPKAATLNDGMNALQLVVFLKFWLSYFGFDWSWQVVVQKPVEISLSDRRHCVGAKQSLLITTFGPDISLDHFWFVLVPVIANKRAVWAINLNTLAKKLFKILIQSVPSFVHFEVWWRRKWTFGKIIFVCFDLLVTIELW